MDSEKAKRNSKYRVRKRKSQEREIGGLRRQREKVSIGRERKK